MPTYSHSRLSSYENCPLKFKYAYIDKVELEEEVESIEAFMGSRVHDVLEKLYRDLNLSKFNSVEELLSFYEDIWEKNWSDNITIVRKGYTVDNYRDTGSRCITDYYTRYNPFDDSKTLGLEQNVQIEIDGHKLTGFIDRLAQKKDGHYEIHDYKSGQYLPRIEYFGKDRQLALYQIGVEKMWDDAECVDLVWHYLAHDKEIRSQRTSEELEDLKSSIVLLIEEIEAASDEDDFPSKESGLCDWCEYKVICPNHTHITATSILPTNEFLKEPGVKLVNRYAKLSEEKKEYLDKIESELEMLREAIIEYAEREGVDVIRGSQKKLKVKKEKKTKLPGKRDIDRETLDALIRKEGKWNEVSDLNTHTLTKILKSGDWSSELKEKIEKYQRTEQNYRLTLSKLKD